MIEWDWTVVDCVEAGLEMAGIVLRAERSTPRIFLVEKIGVG